MLATGGAVGSSKSLLAGGEQVNGKALQMAGVGSSRSLLASADEAEAKRSSVGDRGKVRDDWKCMRRDGTRW